MEIIGNVTLSKEFLDSLNSPVQTSDPYKKTLTEEQILFFCSELEKRTSTKWNYVHYNTTNIFDSYGGMEFVTRYDDLETLERIEDTIGRDSSWFICYFNCGKGSERRVITVHPSQLVQKFPTDRGEKVASKYGILS